MGRRNLFLIIGKTPEVFSEHCANIATSIPPGGESLIELSKRVCSTLFDILSSANGHTIVIVAHLANATNEATASAAIAYFWLRIAHYLVYMLGIPFGRTLAFAGSWLAQICILYQIILVS